MHEGSSYSLLIGSKKLTVNLTDLADAANGSVILTYGQTALVATAVMKEGGTKDTPYFPLVIDYQERNYARGAILGGAFMKREAHPSDEAILTSRYIDRALRPLFPELYRNETQVVITVLAIENGDDPGVIALIGASLALGISDIPWNGPASAVRITRTGNSFAINPSNDRVSQPDVDLIVAAHNQKILMIEGEAVEAPESSTLETITRALEAIAPIEAFQADIISREGKAKRSVDAPALPSAIEAHFVESVSPQIEALLSDRSVARPSKKLEFLQAGWISKAKSMEKVAPLALLEAKFTEKAREIFKQNVFDRGSRPDGRTAEQLRPVSAQIGGISEVLHGSGTFYRGGTHVSTFLTLGSERDALLVEGMEISRTKYFIHHYNFPPFSTGDTGKIGTPNRRAIGHGALAEKALRAVLPPRTQFSYTIRLVSEVFASNGSTSMASVSAGSLALSDGNVPIRSHVAGVAIGLLEKGGGEYTLLRDIQGIEDHLGDMDFKIAGTKTGITAIQLDVKNAGISMQIVEKALDEARAGRLEILEVMNSAKKSTTPKTGVPKIQSITIPIAKIGLLIGPSGSTIQGISHETRTKIDVNPLGIVSIFGSDEATTRAIELIGKHLK